jgi:hypothetical protein
MRVARRSRFAKGAIQASGHRAQLSRAADVAKNEHYAKRLARRTVVTTRQPFSLINY